MSGKRHETSANTVPIFPSLFNGDLYLGGYVGGNLLSSDDAYHILEVVVAEHTVHFVKSMRTIADGLRYGMRTPVTYEHLEQERLAWCAARGYTPRPKDSR